MKGIILAAGKGTRLYPMTKTIPKQLLPIYDKPLLYYPLAVLMEADIRDILIIVAPTDVEIHKRLLGDGSSLGLRITYMVQDVPKGIADAFVVGASFIGEDAVCLILGDNLLHGADLQTCLQQAGANKEGATVFGYWVKDPRAFGVVEFDATGNALSIEEKPAQPKSNYIVPGLYFYDNSVVEVAKNVPLSARGEMEITAVNNAYLKKGALKVVSLGQEFVWMDAGSPNGLMESCQKVERIQRETGHYVACLEEIAYRQGFISLAQCKALGEEMKMTAYGQYILSL